MNLLLNALKNELADLTKAKGLDTARVDYKTNKRGELVIALIIPPSRPGEWTSKGIGSRPERAASSAGVGSPEEKSMGGEDDKKPDGQAPLAVTKPSSGSLETTEAVALAAAASTLLCFPVPPTLARNIIASIGALVSATVAVPIAYLESWSQRVRAVANAREAFTKLAVPIASTALSENKEVTNRAMGFLGNRMLREQRSRETIAQGAIDDLKANPPKEDASGAIDEDWLHMFARHAETKTNADVQAYFSRVLAGEIRKPRSFSPETIEVLAKITPEVGRLFQGFCGITTEFIQSDPAVRMDGWVITNPYGDAGANSLATYGFNYDTICRLQDAGLVRNDLQAWFEGTPGILCVARVGGERLQVRPSSLSPELLKPFRFTAVRFTAAGGELRRIVHTTPNEAYVHKLVEWAKSFGLVPGTPIDIPPT